MIHTLSVLTAKVKFFWSWAHKSFLYCSS